MLGLGKAEWLSGEQYALKKQRINARAYDVDTGESAPDVFISVKVPKLSKHAYKLETRKHNALQCACWNEHVIVRPL